MIAHCPHPFTFTEVMIAAVILGLAAVATLGITGGAQASVLRAEQRWQDQHATSSAIEFFLLAGPHATLPHDLLPTGYDATCELNARDDLHEEAQQPNQKWVLGEYAVNVYRNGQLVTETKISKMLKEKDFE